MIYHGAHGSRIYDGRYRVRAWFRWPDGAPGVEETEPASYEECQWWLEAAPHLPLEVSDGARIHRVRVERAVIEEVR